MKIIPLCSLNQLREGRPLFIYGTGRGARLLERAARLTAGRRTSAFIDSHDRGRLSNIPVLSLEEFRDRKPKNIDLLLATSYFDDIVDGVRGLSLDSCFDGRPIFPALFCFGESLDDRAFVEMFVSAMAVYSRFGGECGTAPECHEFAVRRVSGA